MNPPGSHWLFMCAITALGMIAFTFIRAAVVLVVWLGHAL